MNDFASSFVQKLIYQSDELFSILLDEQLESRGINKEKLVKRLKRSLSELIDGEITCYSRSGYCFYNGDLEKVIELRFTDIDYQMDAVKNVPLGKRIIGDEHLYLIGLKTKKTEILEIFRPKNVLREEDINKLERLN